MYDEDFEDYEPEQDVKVDAAGESGITITIPRLPISESDIIRGISKHFADRLSPVIEAKLSELAEGAFNAAIEKAADELLANFLNRPHRKTNNYGETIGEPITMTEFIAEKFEKVMTQKVDTRGYPDNGGSALPRMEWLIKRLGEDMIVSKAKEEIEKVKKAAEIKVSQAVAEFIAKKVATPALALPSQPDDYPV